MRNTSDAAVGDLVINGIKLVRINGLLNYTSAQCYGVATKEWTGQLLFSHLSFFISAWIVVVAIFYLSNACSC